MENTETLLMQSENTKDVLLEQLNALGGMLSAAQKAAYTTAINSYDALGDGTIETASLAPEFEPDAKKYHVCLAAMIGGKGGVYAKIMFNESGSLQFCALGAACLQNKSISEIVLG
jgi:hypothetical protein